MTPATARNAEEQHQFVSIVERKADRLLRLVGDLLLAAQVEAGARPLPVASRS